MQRNEISIRAIKLAILIKYIQESYMTINVCHLFVV